MKCTDRELLEKLLRLKERADQRRSLQQSRRGRTRANAPAAFALHPDHRSRGLHAAGVSDARSSAETDRGSAAAAQDASGEGSIAAARLPGASLAARLCA